MLDELNDGAGPQDSGFSASKGVELEPYVGPRSFESQDTDFFFGRERETSEILSLIIAHPVVLLYARSGAGKTSLLNTKLRPLLEREGFEVLPTARMQWAIPTGIDPNDIPNLYVFNVISCWSAHRMDSDRQKDLTLDGYLGELDRLTDEDGLPRPLLLIFDQFEELFTSYPHRWQDREPFFQQIQRILENNPRLRVLFAMREDHIAHLDPFVHLLPENLRSRYRLERLRQAAALSAIINPLEVLREKTSPTGQDFLTPSYMPGVPDKLVTNLMTIQVETEAGQTEEKLGEFIEPVQLQIVCQSLWQKLPPGIEKISEEHLETLGNVDQALSNFYEMSIRTSIEQSGFDEMAVRDFFEYDLITPAGTRGIVYKDEQKGETGSIPNSVIEILENLHLVRMEWRAGSPWYELVHDRFIQPIRDSNRIYKQAYRNTQLSKILSSIPLHNPRPLPHSEKEVRADLRCLLENVKTTIRGKYDNSEPKTPRLTLLKTQHTEMVDNPVIKALEISNITSEKLPVDKKAGLIFDEVGRLLLILGGPGSGKTYSLYELAQELLVKAEQNLDTLLEAFTHPIPVILNLSTWTSGWKTLKDWLVEELLQQYKVPRTLGDRWLSERRLIPLLDGLDEVETKSQVRCVEALNNFVEDIGPPGLAVCSRTADYEGLPIRLKFYGAIILEPITDQQIYQFSENFEDESGGLRLELADNVSLRKLARSPLMLNLICSSYHRSADSLLKGQGIESIDMDSKQFVEEYVTNLLTQKKDVKGKFSENQVRNGLSWLANGMKQHHLTVFSLEQLQPSWISSRLLQWTYIIGTRLISWSLCGLLMGGLVGGLTQVGQSSYLLVSLEIYSLVGITLGAIVGGSVGLFDLIRFGLVGARRKVSKTTSSITQIFTNLAGLSIPFCLSFIVLVVFLLKDDPDYDVYSSILLGLVFSVFIGPALALPFALITGVRGSRQSLARDIQVVEVLDWSLGKTLQRARLWLIAGGLIGLSIAIGLQLIIGRVVGIINVWDLFLANIRGGIAGIFLGALIFGLIRSTGLKHKFVELKPDPNQGLRLMRRNAFFGGMILALYYGVIAGVLIGLFWIGSDNWYDRLIKGLRIGLGIGSGLGLLALFWYGIFDAIQHTILRLVLKLQGDISYNYAEFLNYATKLNLLKNAGSNYIFPNRLLKEHFAKAGENRFDTSPGKPFFRRYFSWKSCLLVLVPGVFIICCLGSIATISLTDWTSILGLEQSSSQAELLVSEGESLAEEGNIEEALGRFDAARNLDPDVEITAASWNTLCWFGSLWGYPAKVKHACDETVALAEIVTVSGLESDFGNLASFRDSRGVNRALLGDIPGAIEDFEAYVDYYQDSDSYQEYVVKRQGWIEALQAGENPFNDKMLKDLLNE